MLSMLMYIIVALTVVTGIAVLTSNVHQKGRASALSFSIAIFGAALWVLFVQLFRNAGDEASASVFHQIFAVSALLMPFGSIAFALSLLKRRALAIAIAVVALIAEIVVGTLIILQSSLFYSEIVMVEGNNHALLTDSGLVAAYSGIFGISLTAAVIIVAIKAIQSKKDLTFRRGLTYFGLGLAVSSLVCVIFNIILPTSGSYDLFWTGPLSIAVVMLFTYFSTLKYRLFINGSHLLRSLTYLVVVAMAAILYTCLFYLVFSLVFRGASPSDEITVFHFMMIVLVILLLPTINHFINFIKKLISENKPLEEKGDGTE